MAEWHNKKSSSIIFFFLNIKKCKTKTNRKTWKLVSEGPNPIISKYNGTLEVEGKTQAVGLNNFVLRGCSLRNTKFMIGLCVYTGH